MRKTLLLLLLVCTTAVYGQSVTLKGKVTDDTDLPLESATVYLSRVKDSSVVDYTISDKNGNWELKTPKITSPVYLKIAFLGFTDHKAELATLEADRDFGTIKLSDDATLLNEVTIVSEIPPIRIKKDTLEFNASSFKVRPDANVEALLKQLPGVVITPDKKITVNGKEVNQILVNGKPFFDENGQIALQNLPADMIDKVQVSDTKTKKEELAKQSASGDNASINLTIKKDKDKGYFGRITGGYGSDKRYETSGLVNYFKDRRKISVMASSNNINSSGFSMDEVFGSMGGGMGSRYLMGAGNAPGITRSNTAGLNYSDELIKNFETSGNYSYTGSSTENNRRYEAINYLPEGEDADNPGRIIDKSYMTGSESQSESETSSHNFNSDINWKIDSTLTISFRPRFTKTTSTSSSSSSSFSQRLEDGKLLNEATSDNYSEGDNSNFSSNVNLYKSFAKKGRGLSIYLMNANSKNDRQNLNRSNTIKYRYPAVITETEVDNRDQILYNHGTNDNYFGTVEYFEPITDSLRLTAGASFSQNNNISSRNTFDFDHVTGDYTVTNEALSNYLTSKTGILNPKAGISLDQNKLRLSLDLGAQVVSFDNTAFYLGDEYSLDKNYFLPQGNARATYRFDKNKSLNASYRYDVTFPQASQLLPVEDISNPLNTFTGNPNLDPTQSHNVRLGFRNFNNGTRMGWNLSATGILYRDQVVQFTETNESAESATTYRNISGARNASFSANWNKSFKEEAHDFLLSAGIYSSFGVSKGYLNGELFNSKSVSLSPSFNFTYQYGELLTISPSYSFNYNEFSYTDYSVSSASSFVHNVNLSTTSYWPKHVVFGNDFGYTYNSNVPDGFKKDFYLWNSSIGYNFLDDKLMFKVKIYDVLDQNTGIKRTVEPTAVTNEENIVLKRYVMFSLTFKLDRFGGEKPKGSRPRSGNRF